MTRLIKRLDLAERQDYQDRLQKAVTHYKQCLGSQRELSIRQTAKRYGITRWEAIRDRVANGGQTREAQNARRQRLTPLEEKVLAHWISYSFGQGWPPRVAQLRIFGEELLRDRGDTVPLSLAWTRGFLCRHPHLRSKFVSIRDRKRVKAQDPEIISDWFRLFKEQKETYQVHDDDVYNLDEKGVIIGMANKLKCIISKYDNPYSTYSGNREWVTSTECVSLSGRCLGSWTIFKGKVVAKSWGQTMKRLGEQGWHISTSPNGWTDNELGLEYLKTHFEPQTQETHSELGYRILIIDGHASHVTIEVIKFCVQHKIILLCLLPHSTHYL
jgi:hypothetical protein